MSPAGMLLGLLAGAGLLAAVAWSPPSRRPRLDDRLAPYLRDAPPSPLLAAAGAGAAAGSGTRTPFPTVERLLAPVVADAARRIDGWLGGAASVRARLGRAGLDTTVDGFRAEQLAWAAAGFAAALGTVLVAAAAGAPPRPLPALAWCAALGVGGGVARDVALSVAARRRDARLLAELPDSAELLALAVAAGDGVVPALGRVARLRGGELAGELRAVLAEAGDTGVAAALDRLAARTGVPELARFADGLVVALERGTPLADVLRAPAAAARAAARRALLETAGRREIAMLVPVVFLILPVVVVFALYPGFHGLQVVAP